MTKRVDEIWEINNRKIELTNLNKIFWPDQGFTKKDIIDYYDVISPYILPYLKDRPESMNRFPNGIRGEHFYQKNIDPANLPEWIETKSFQSGKNNINYLLCQNKETLIFMVNLGCIELNPWSSKTNSPENPDFLVIDLDPLEINFESIIETALAVKKVCDQIGIPSYPKTSGASGMHVYIPMGARYNYEQVKQFAKIIAILTNKLLPDITSLERLPTKRIGKVYLDYLQNDHGKTVAAPYSIRPVPGALVSTPLSWEEVKSGLNPNSFTIKNTVKRLKKIGDIFQPVLEDGIDIEDILGKLVP